MEPKWWHKAVVYQIYPRSFKDSNQDGIGDLRGIIEKVDYLVQLGINTIWLNPIFSSPNDDNGYDISDFRGIMADFGTMADFDELVTVLKANNIRLVMDLVLNHTSDEHPWFIEARKSLDNPYRDYYLWAKGFEGKEPTNWESFFGGSLWEQDQQTQEYYLHLFSQKMPDLNWSSSKLRQEMYEIANFWSEKGVDGFRIDAVVHIDKELTYPQAYNPGGRPYVMAEQYYANRPLVHDYCQEFYQAVLANKEIMTVGEAASATIEEALKYTAPEREEFNMIITFEAISFDIDPNLNPAVPPKWTQKRPDLQEIKRVWMKWQDGLYGKGWNTLYWNNHDVPRVVSRYGNCEQYHQESAKMLATLLYCLWGTPYILQGEEIGMTNVAFPQLTDYRDVEIQTFYREALATGKVSHEEAMAMIHARSRDNARTPMQWDTSDNGGFSQVKPWIGVNENYQTINVAANLADPNSIFYHYQRLIYLRTKSSYSDLLTYGKTTLLLPEDDAIFAYTRTYGEQTLLVVANFFEAPKTVTLAGEVAEIIVQNYPEVSKQLGTISLRPYEANVYLLK
ncbi:MAG: glycoside hydrolase family 13 protein [Culicoidibacterales bacterium]